MTPLREEVAWAICEASGDCPARMTYVVIEPGVMEPYGEAWTRYLKAADAVIPIVLGRAAEACEEQARDFLSPEYATQQPLSSMQERFACSECAAAIRQIGRCE